MKHFVNLALLLFFVTLVASGLLRFFKPFDLITTRLHITFGIGTLLLVGFHLASRGKYFLSLLRGRRRSRGSSGHGPLLVPAVVIFWGYLFSAASWNLWPVDLLIGASYEARHAREIFRANPKTAFEPIESGLQVKRVTDKAASIRLELEWGDSFSPAHNKEQSLGSRHPQMAIWAETEDGVMLETLFVSQACAAANEINWQGHLLSRSEILPHWCSRHKNILRRQPDESVDAVSAATPMRDFSMEGCLQMDAQPFVVYVEINAPGDANDFFHHNQSAQNAGYAAPGLGQPSVIYEAFVFPQQQRRCFLLELSSHSGDFEDTGELAYDLQHLTTAKQIVEKILLHVDWPADVALNGQSPE